MINRRMLTPFGEKVSETDIPLNEYPRPQMERDIWQNLNGEWDFAVYKTGEEFAGYQRKIRVPFSPESALSGYNGEINDVMPDDTAYYQKVFTFRQVRDTVLLHFGAVDYACTVTLNDVKLGTHCGGYTPFTFDVTEVIQEGENVLEVEVTDPSNAGVQAYGKQSLNRGGIWYTAQSGIWQTVWLEQIGIKGYALSKGLFAT